MQTAAALQEPTARRLAAHNSRLDLASKALIQRSQLASSHRHSTESLPICYQDAGLFYRQINQA